MARILTLDLLVLLGLLLSLHAAIVEAAEEKPCTVHDGGKFYDLSPLKSSTDYEMKTTEGRSYFINVCRPVIHETWAMKIDKPEDVAGYTRRDHGDFSLGYVNTTLTVRDGHPVITMTDGSYCSGDNGLRASTAIRFICDTSVFGTGQPQLIAELPPIYESACGFVVEWRTHVACPTREAGESWGVTAIIATLLGVGLLLYIVVGTLYNRFVLDLHGFDQIPRYSFFTLDDTMRLCRNCVDGLKNWFSGRGSFSGGYPSRDWGSGASSRYHGVAASREEGAAMMGGPPGFLYEDEEDEPPESPENSAARAEGMDTNGVIRL